MNNIILTCYGCQKNFSSKTLKSCPYCGGKLTINYSDKETIDRKPDINYFLKKKNERPSR